LNKLAFINCSRSDKLPLTSCEQWSELVIEDMLSQSEWFILEHWGCELSYYAK